MTCDECAARRPGESPSATPLPSPTTIFTPMPNPPVGCSAASTGRRRYDGWSGETAAAKRRFRTPGCHALLHAVLEMAQARSLYLGLDCTIVWYTCRAPHARCYSMVCTAMRTERCPIRRRSSGPLWLYLLWLYLLWRRSSAPLP